MLSVLKDLVRIELLIDGIRDELYKKLTRKVPPDKFDYTPRDGDPTFHISTRSPAQVFSDTFTARSSHDIQDENHPSLPEESGTSSHSQVPMECSPAPDIAGPSPKSSFFVQSSFLLNDKSERIFQVLDEYGKHFYYAFKIRGYIVCPAFLAGYLGITDYSCLSVGNKFNYYYIFLDASSDNPMAYFFGDSTVFTGRHHFDVPSESKIFSLNRRNKDVKCFIPMEYLLQRHGIKAFDESDTYKMSNSPFMMNSSIEPNYFYVPVKMIDKFKKDYGTLFEQFMYKHHSPLVLKNCLSFHEFKNLSRPITPKKGDTRFTETLKNVFSIPSYEREDFILEKLVNHIKTNHREGKMNKVKSYYASMIAILQSSGYGKSKLMEILGSRTPTFYSSLQKGNGFPYKTFFLTRFIEELDKIVPMGIPPESSAYPAADCYINNVATAVYIYILRILYVILNDPNNVNSGLKGNFQIDVEIENHIFFSDIKERGGTTRREEIFKILFAGLESICKYSKNISFDGSNTLKLHDIDEIGTPLNIFNILKHKTEKLEDEVVLLLEKLREKNKDLPAVFVIDEAHGLKYKGMNQNYKWDLQDIFENDHRDLPDRTPYNVFRRVFRIYTNAWEHIILILVSTCGQINVLIPELEDDNSRRPEGSHKYMENFALTHTYCVNSEIAPFINAEMFRKGKYKGFEGINGWVEFLESKFRKVEYFKFGRPLIYGIFKLYVEEELNNGQYDLERAFKDCNEFRFFAEKLFGGNAYKCTVDKALLFSMFNFAFGTNFLPSNIKKEDLIESYLMTLVKYLDEFEQEGRYIVGGFLPEGVFNFLSAKYFIGFSDSLSDILFYSVRYGLCNIGNFGELLAKIILLKTIFDIIDDRLSKVRKLVFEPVFLENFLLNLCGKVKESCVNNFFASNKSLTGSRISFGYFEHFPRRDIYFPFDLMAKSLFKGSAVALNNQFPGIDLMIPLVLRNGDISFLGIQVKFVKEEYANKTVKEALDRMTFSNMFSSLQRDCQKPQNDRPFGLVILALGNYSSYDVSVARGENIPASVSQTEAPPVLIIKGIPHSTKQFEKLFNDAPSDFSYHDISVEYLEECDRLYELTQEIIPQWEGEETQYVEHRTKPRRSSFRRIKELKSPEAESFEDGQSFPEPLFFDGSDRF